MISSPILSIVLLEEADPTSTQILFYQLESVGGLLPEMIGAVSFPLDRPPGKYGMGLNRLDDSGQVIDELT